jgi:hypothetical protein
MGVHGGIRTLDTVQARPALLSLMGLVLITGMRDTGTASMLVPMLADARSQSPPPHAIKRLRGNPVSRPFQHMP